MLVIIIINISQFAKGNSFNFDRDCVIAYVLQPDDSRFKSVGCLRFVHGFLKVPSLDLLVVSVE